MYGLLTTLFSGSGAYLQPVAAPLALVPLAAVTPPGKDLFGRITTDHARHGDYQRRLARVVDSGFARFAI